MMEGDMPVHITPSMSVPCAEPLQESHNETEVGCISVRVDEWQALTEVEFAARVYWNAKDWTASLTAREILGHREAVGHHEGHDLRIVHEQADLADVSCPHCAEKDAELAKYGGGSTRQRRLDSTSARSTQIVD